MSVWIALTKSIQRIHQLARCQGGHHIPDEDVRHRYARSLPNLNQLVKITNEILGMTTQVLSLFAEGTFASIQERQEVFAGQKELRSARYLYDLIDMGQRWSILP